MWCIGIKKNEEQEIIREHVFHRNRLLAIKPRIDTQPPKKRVHLSQKSKPKVLKEEEEHFVQIENNLLLKKMMDINTRVPKFTQVSDFSSTKSLNVNSRTNLLSKITEENQKILNRLTSIKSNYSFKKFDEEFKYKQYLTKKLSENSRRISSSGFTPSFDSTRTPISRLESSSRFNRPMTAAANRNKSSYLEL